MRETCENLPLGAGHWLQNDPAEDDQKPTADRKPPPLPLRKLYQSIMDVTTIQDYLSRKKRLLRRRKKKHCTIPWTSQRYTPHFAFAFLSLHLISVLILPSYPANHPRRKDYDPVLWSCRHSRAEECPFQVRCPVVNNKVILTKPWTHDTRCAWAGGTCANYPVFSSIVSCKGKLVISSHPGHVEIFSHTVNSPSFFITVNSSV
jgi:hypothetical protein